MFLFYPEMKHEAGSSIETKNNVFEEIEYAQCPSFQDIDCAKNILSGAGIKMAWMQWMLGKVLSDFSLHEWRIFIGLAISIEDETISPGEVRQYVLDMFNWAQLSNRLNELQLDVEEWPEDASRFIDIPHASATRLHS